MARTARAAVLEKQAQALVLVRAGRSFDEIAEDMGYASRSGPWRLVTKALKSRVDDVAEDHLQLELARLDAMQVAVWDAAMAGEITSANMLLRIIAQRVRLLGLEKPNPEPPPVRTVVMTDADRAAYDAGEGRYAR